jgi:D-tyrosyl-tRNA(Tyr) deacylase
MRLVVQRVEKAKVVRAEDGTTVGEISEGLFVLVGFKKGDTESDINPIVDKLAKLRVMKDGEKKMNLSVKDTSGGILVVSQFTLHADIKDGNRPSFINAEEPEKAKILYELFIKKLREKEIKVETGSFGDYMKIEAILDGPVTILFS